MSAADYVYPGTEILKNKFGIKNAKNLEITEKNITNARVSQPITTKPLLTTKGLRTMHKHIFGDIYEWAGEYRTCELTKGSSAFEYAEHVPNKLNQAFKSLREDNFYKGLTKENFSRKAASFLHKLNDIHPFREGNGRVQRLFLEHLAHQAGHKLDIKRIEPKKWIDASIQSFNQGDRGDHPLMTEVINEAIVGRTLTRRISKSRNRENDGERTR